MDVGHKVKGGEGVQVPRAGRRAADIHTGHRSLRAEDNGATGAALGVTGVADADPRDLGEHRPS
jgi:hypothetical protein